MSCSRQSLEAWFERLGYFKGLSPASSHAVAEICLLKTCKKREILFNEGQKGYSIYGLLSGAVQLYKTTDDGRPSVIKVIRPGELFGEVILFETDRYPVTAEMLTAGRVFLLPKHQFLCLLEREDFRNDFIAMLMRKQRWLAQQIQFLSAYDVEDRFFLFLKDQFGEQKRYDLTMSKKDLAAAVGATPETLSRLLNRLEAEGWIKQEGKLYEVNERVWRRYR
ncbi:MAG: Crp/Fnr family transcriptional regulator [candidate division KSB1 bacterium]|nr:Crp/Fnr family transcriptional regulator [candidate division KSB1 bacterium]